MIKSKEKKDKGWIRPVRCFICKKRMYYWGQKKFEPEYRITDDEFSGYVHQRCIKR